MTKVDNASLNQIFSAYAEDAVNYAATQGHILDYSVDSLAVVEKMADVLANGIPKGFFSKFIKSSPTPQQIDQMVKILAGYVGEVIKRARGGEWKMSEEFQTPALFIDGGQSFILSKVHKRIINGTEDNIAHFAKMVIENKFAS